MPGNEEQQYELLMNAEQFLLAVTGTRLTEKNIRIAREVLVDARTRTEVIEEHGIIKQRLAQILESVESNYARNLQKAGRYHIEVTVDAETRDKLFAAEKEIIQTIITKK